MASETMDGWLAGWLARRWIDAGGRPGQNSIVDRCSRNP
jgi:hypothetical protein